MVRKYLPLLSLACGIGGAVCYVLALTRDYDDSIRHFAAGSPFGVCLFILCAAGIVLGAVSGFLARGANEDVPPQNSVSVTFAGCAAAFMTLASLGYSFVGMTPGLLVFARMFFQACAAVFLLLLAMTKDKSSQLYAGLSLTPTVFFILRLMELYYDSVSYAANSPVKMLRLELCVAFALYFTAEARVALGTTKPSTFVPFATAAMVLGIVGGAGEIVVPLMSAGADLSLVDGAMYLSVALLALFRMYSLRHADPRTAPASDEDAADEAGESDNNDENEANG